MSLKQSVEATATIESLTHEGRGVAHIDGKAVFIDGALPGEEVRFRYRAKHRTYDEGDTVDVINASPDRVAPRCAHFEMCGGCSMQHVSAAAQIQSKQQVLLDNLQRIGHVEPEHIAPPLTAAPWGYRRRARLGAKFVDKKNAMLVGFHEKRSHFLAAIERCEVLHPAFGERIVALRDLLRSLDAYKRIPQLEVACGDDAAAMVVRHLEALTPADRERFVQFGRAHDIEIFLQSGGPDTIHLLWPEQSRLSYRLPEFDVELVFRPTDFVQVNSAINRQMVSQALDWLALQGHERVLDLYCGLGNFTLPLARRARLAIGVEGERKLVQAGEANAARNHITNAQFFVGDLAHPCDDLPWTRGQHYDAVLLDPPRVGAEPVLSVVGRSGASRVVYVSCNPATLARDAGILVRDHGFKLKRAGAMDMFPHTTHTEAMALFER